MKEIFGDKPYINLELMDNREFAQNDPRGFFRKIPEGAILDEIQRAPNLTSYIQGIVDEKQKNGMFILTGNQQFEVSLSVSQSLAGRTALLRLLPFSIAEIARNYSYSNIEKLIYKGFYPRIHENRFDATQALADYFETYVERDVLPIEVKSGETVSPDFLEMCNFVYNRTWRS